MDEIYALPILSVVTAVGEQSLVVEQTQVDTPSGGIVLFDGNTYIRFEVLRLKYNSAVLLSKYNDLGLPPNVATVRPVRLCLSNAKILPSSFATYKVSFVASEMSYGKVRAV